MPLRVTTMVSSFDFSQDDLSMSKVVVALSESRCVMSDATMNCRDAVKAAAREELLERLDDARLQGGSAG